MNGCRSRPALCVAVCLLRGAVCCSVLQCVCSVLLRVAVCCSVLQCVAVCCSVLQRCCSVSLTFAVLKGVGQDQHCALQCVCSVLQFVAMSGCVFLCVGVCCCVLQCEWVSFKTSIVRCSVFAVCLQCVAVCLLCVGVCCSVLQCERVSFKTSLVRCSVFAVCQSVFAACCSVLLRVAACCSVDSCR